MRSVGDVINEIIRNYPLLEEGLSKGIINLSALARELKPNIEKRLLKLVKEGAIVMALKRAKEKLTREKKKKFLNILDLTVRSNLSILTFANSNTLLGKIKNLQQNKSQKKELVFIISENIRETTFLVSSVLMNLIKKTLKDERPIIELSNLSAITLRLAKETVLKPGIYYQILKMLTWENINIVEIFSTYTELTIVIDDKDVTKAFSVLKNFS